jgi:hypothetical protein
LRHHSCGQETYKLMGVPIIGSRATRYEWSLVKNRMLYSSIIYDAISHTTIKKQIHQRKVMPMLRKLHFLLIRSRMHTPKDNIRAPKIKIDNKCPS